MAKVCDLSKVSRLVTWAMPPDPFPRLLRTAGVEMIIAE